MKFLLDSSVLQDLEQLYGSKTPEILFNALKFHSLDHGMMELTLDELIRRQKVSMRLSVSENEKARDILLYLNEATGKSFKEVPANMTLIRSLLKDYTRKDIETVIDNKTSKWKGTDMEDYLRPATLFRKSNFDGYLNEAPSAKVVERNFANKLDALLGDT